MRSAAYLGYDIQKTFGLKKSRKLAPCLPTLTEGLSLFPARLNEQIVPGPHPLRTRNDLPNTGRKALLRQGYKNSSWAHRLKSFPTPERFERPNLEALGWANRSRIARVRGGAGTIWENEPESLATTSFWEIAYSASAQIVPDPGTILKPFFHGRKGVNSSCRIGVNSKCRLTKNSGLAPPMPYWFEKQRPRTQLCRTGLKNNDFEPGAESMFLQTTTSNPVQSRCKSKRWGLGRVPCGSKSNRCAISLGIFAMST